MLPCWQLTLTQNGLRAVLYLSPTCRPSHALTYSRPCIPTSGHPVCYPTPSLYPHPNPSLPPRCTKPPSQPPLLSGLHARNQLLQLVQPLSYLDKHALCPPQSVSTIP